MRILRELVPISVLQTSYLATVIIGLLLARGTMKGNRDTYRATSFLLLTRIVANLLRGLDYEEAILLAVTAILLWKHATLFKLPSRTGGTTTAGLTPIALGLFAFAAVGLTAYQ